MKASRPPIVATWLLEHFRSGFKDECITGDLMEAYHQHGRSRSWYWKQVIAAIVVSFCQEVMAHPVLALRAIAVGWAVNYAFGRSVGAWLRLPWFRRLFPSVGSLISPGAIALWMVGLCIGVASGWIVARLHRPHQTGMVLLFTIFVFFRVARLMVPEIWSLGADTLTNTRYLPYLLNDLARLTLPPIATLFGGLWGTAPENQSGGSRIMREIKWFNLGSLLALMIALCAFIVLRSNSNPIYYPGVGGVGFPSCKYCPKPTYSESALRAKYEGNVLLEAVITPEGHASKIRVVKGPDQGLGVEEEAIDALGRWRFNPAQGPTGKPVAVRVPIQVAFHLPGA